MSRKVVKYMDWMVPSSVLIVLERSGMVLQDREVESHVITS